MEGRQLTERFLRIVNLYGEAEGKPTNFGTAAPLSRSEIHTIEAIGGHPGINVTMLAQTQGISKSAVSQMLGRLKRKDLVTQKSANGSGRDTELSLTKAGRVAYREHEASHARLYAEIDACAAAIGEEAAAELIGLLDHFEEFLQERADKG